VQVSFEKCVNEDCCKQLPGATVGPRKVQKERKRGARLSAAKVAASFINPQ
jgi:hypothetical protein